MTTGVRALVASIANMKTVSDQRGVLAWSPTTGEEFTAHPGDYFTRGMEWIIEDENGEPMILVRRVTQMVIVEVTA